MDQAAGRIFDIHELFLYRASSGIGSGGDKIPSPTEVARIASKNSIKLLAADRWTTASLYGQDHPFELVLPTFRSFNNKLQVSRLKPEGTGALVEKGDEAELSTLLERANIDYSKTDLEARVLFAFKGGGGELWWTGFTFIEW